MKKILIIFVIFMLVGPVFIMAQTRTGWNADRIVREYENLARRMEQLARSASTERGWDRVKDRTLDQINIDANAITVEMNYFTQSGGTMTDAQRSRLMDAIRRIEKSNGEFQYWMSQRLD